jgi:hypothetical protein
MRCEVRVRLEYGSKLIEWGQGARRRPNGGSLSAQFAQRVIDNVAPKIVLRAEMVMDQRRDDLGYLGNLGQRGTVETVAGKCLQGGGQNSLPRVGALYGRWGGLLRSGFLQDVYLPRPLSA